MKKLFYFKKIGSILMIFAASFTSCKQDETAIPNPINEVSKNDESSSSLVSETLSCNSKDRFAKVLSKAIIDNDMLEFVLNEAKRLENGDPTFLYALAKQKKTNQGLTFSQKLTDADETKDDFFTKKVLSEDPLTSIFLYVPENFKLATVTSIKKVYYYCSTDEGDMNASVIYYENGKKYSTLKSTLPTEPVIVVLPNDRVKVERNADNLKANSANYKLLGTDDNQHYILEGYFPTKATEDKEPNSTLTDRWCTRDIYKQREGVYRFLFSDNLESWGCKSKLRTKYVI